MKWECWSRRWKVIEAVTEKLSKDPNTRVATSQKRQAKPDRKNSGALTSEVTSVAGSLQTPPKRKTKGNALLMSRDMVQNRKKKKDPDQERELPQERTDLSPWKQRLPFANLENTDEHRNEKPGSTFKMPWRTKSPIWIKHCNAQGSTKPQRRTNSIESMDRNTDRVVASVNLEGVLK